MREQPKKVKTGQKKKTIYIAITIGLLLVSLAVVIVCICLPKKTFTPPEFDLTAKAGVPTPDESFLYGGTKTDYGFSFQMASNLYQQEDGSLMVYLTNPEENDVYLMIDIIDKDTNKSLYKSGVIKPGEYVEKLQKEMSFDNELRKATIQIYAFETENWYSEGTVLIDCEIQPW